MKARYHIIVCKCWNHCPGSGKQDIKRITSIDSFWILIKVGSFNSGWKNREYAGPAWKPVQVPAQMQINLGECKLHMLACFLWVIANANSFPLSLNHCSLRSESTIPGCFCLIHSNDLRQYSGLDRTGVQSYAHASAHAIIRARRAIKRTPQKVKSGLGVLWNTHLSLYFFTQSPGC